MNPCYCPCGCTSPLNGDTFCPPCGKANWSSRTGALAEHVAGVKTADGRLVHGEHLTAWVARCPRCGDGPRSLRVDHGTSLSGYWWAGVTTNCCGAEVTVRCKLGDSRIARAA